ncbi:hypothetical protein ELI39_36145 [Rhizobium ruizarguesonis]|nr:hypothetical protein ELI39_36145 [Rhizobium ruizarguesonis]
MPRGRIGSQDTAKPPLELKVKHDVVRKPLTLFGIMLQRMDSRCLIMSHGPECSPIRSSRPGRWPWSVRSSRA